jgi:ABC-type phosphate transport system substrate-binding protein
MKLSGLISSGMMKCREVTNTIRYPLQTASAFLGDRFRQWYENVDIPGTRQSGKRTQENDNKNLENTLKNHIQNSPSNNTNVVNGKVIQDDGKFNTDNRYYNTTSNGYLSGTLESDNNASSNTLVQILPSSFTTYNDSKRELEPLEKGYELIGGKGNYQISSEEPIDESENKRWYRGINIRNSKLVWIREYLFSELDLGDKIITEIREKFKKVPNSFNFKNSEGKDFRLLLPWDVITRPHEQRCFLIIDIPQTIYNSSTLREYLELRNVPMRGNEVREVIKQILQSLLFLHSKKIRFLDENDIPLTLTHGNINLDSLYIDEQQFFIYLSNFSFWENIFSFENNKLNYSTIKDLKNLGYLAFYLWNSTENHPVFQHKLEPSNQQDWLYVDDIALQNFIRSLIGLEGSPNFNNAEEALLKLVDLKPEVPPAPSNQAENSPDNIPTPVIKNSLAMPDWFWRGFRFGIPLLLLSALIIWVINSCIRQQEMPIPIMPISTSKLSDSQYKRFVDVPIDDLQFNNKPITIIYTSKSIQNNLTMQGIFQGDKSGDKLRTFHQELQSRLNNYEKSIIISTPIKQDINEAITDIKKGKADVLISLATSKKVVDLIFPKNTELEHNTIAYDGIVVYVPFSITSTKERQSIANILNGSISIDKLKDIYSGKISNWNQVDRNLDLNIKAYKPNDRDLIDSFESLPYPVNFISTEKKETNSITESKIIGEQKETNSVLGARILGEYENENIGGIGFGLLSQVYGQCSVYPLSLNDKQILVQTNGQPINPHMDLCNDKGNYRPDVNAFKDESNYPFKYPIFIAYKKDSQVGEYLVKLLQTDEGQQLLSEAGLVPIRELKN